VAVEERERFNYWFLMEMYYSPVLIPRIQAAYGLCPEHVTFLVAAGAGYRVTVMGEYLVEYAVERIAMAETALNGKGIQTSRPHRVLTAAGEHIRPRDVCLGCESDRQGVELFLRELGRKISQPDVMALYRGSPGLCLPHFLQAASLLPPEDFEPLARDLLERLESREGVAACKEAPAPTSVPSPASTSARDLPEPDGCPVCLRRAEDLARFCSALVGEGWRRRETLQGIRDALGFCAMHTRTLAAVAPPEVVGAISAEAADAVADRLRACLRIPAGSSAEPVTRPLRRRALAKAREALAGRDRCPACERIAAAEQSLVSELVDALKTEGRARRFRDGPGLCMRHFVEVALLCESPELLRILLQRQRQGLLSLLRDLREFLRKVDYRYRDEPKGPEQDAWLRALERFSGRRPEDGIGHPPRAG
jgi:hypothetical protein